ncbi:hypothetical protein ACFWN1_05395 [Streptomyces sp. NPDC058459]|uniref:hypothetical protein n=1 Tax=Streptomyces sp. NPDC058459 TaxID=3346508 RepID=UPI00366508A9
MNTTEWADAQRRQAEHDALIVRLADREAEREHDLIAACDDCAPGSRPVPEPVNDLNPPPAPRQRPTSLRRSRGR